MAELTEFDKIRRAFADGTIHSASDAELRSAIGALANKAIQNETVRQQAGIMADGIHSIMLHRILDSQENRNQKAQFWFMVLAFAGVLAAVAQVVVAFIR